MGLDYVFGIYYRNLHFCQSVLHRTGILQIERHMKKLLVSAAALLLSAPAFAEIGIVTAIEANTRDVFKRTPETTCFEKEVPVYEEVNTSTTEDIVGGAALGGILGGIATDSREGAGIGALFGGLLGASNTQRVIIGYRVVESCETTTVTHIVSEVIDYDVTFTWNGFTGEGKTQIPYEIGDEIPVQVLLVYRD